jgi:hypothetical protein
MDKQNYIELKDVSVKKFIIDLLYKKINLIDYKYEIFKSYNDYLSVSSAVKYILPNLTGKNIFLIYYKNISFIIPKQKLCFRHQSINYDDVDIKFRDESVKYDITIFSAKMINNNMYVFDCYYFLGKNIIDLDLYNKFTYLNIHIKNDMNLHSSVNMIKLFKVDNIDYDIFTKYLKELKGMSKNDNENIRCNGLILLTKKSGISYITIDFNDNSIVQINNKFNKNNNKNLSNYQNTYYNYFLNITYDYETDKSLEKEIFEIYKLNDNIPDIYYRVDNDVKKILSIPSLKISHRCRDIIKEKEKAYSFLCVFNKNINNWVPVSEIKR